MRDTRGQIETMVSRAGRPGEVMGWSERWLRRLGGIGALVVLASLYGGLWRARRRPLEARPARTSFLRRGPGLLAASVLFFEACRRLWRPLPWALGRSGRGLAVVTGALLYAAGLGLVLWGRLTLGDMFNFSTSQSAPLYAQQRLITHGPFALVRHPMYLGYGLAAAGGLLLYRTWTTLLLLPAALGLVFRARREEAALAARFGEAWAAYARRVPAWIPRLRLRISERQLPRKPARIGPIDRPARRTIAPTGMPRA